MSHPAQLFYSRERRNELFDPAFRLKRNLTIAEGTSNFPAVAQDENITIAVDFVVGTTAASGVLFELGDATRNLGLALNGTGGVEVVVGDTGSGTITGVVGAAGQRVRLVISVRSGAGTFRVWVNGKDELRGTYTAGAHSNGVLIGVAQVNGLTRLTNSGALTNASIFGEQISVYLGQLPRHF